MSTDENVIRYKNKIPIIPFEERIAIIESITYVDQAVPQKNMNKMSAWEKLKFDVIFHGDDWKGTDKWREYEQNFKVFDVDIVYFTYTKTTSSTKLRSVLNSLYSQKNYRI